MPSSKSENPRKGGIRLLSQELAALGMDLHATLREEPRFLMDPRLLAALHQELHNQLGRLEADAALLQMGFLHGLRDALLMVHRGFGPLATRGPDGPVGSRLPLRLARPTAGPSGQFALRGSWPEVMEAEAVITSRGLLAEPACVLSAGFTSGWLSGIYDADILALETGCKASGAGKCDFLALDAAQWESGEDVTGREALLALPFQPLRDVVLRHLEEEAPPPTEASHDFESGAPVVHVWGPVMVIPFSGAEESLLALDLIGRDPGARDVCVVVVDLSGAIIDEGFGAAALEQVLDAVEGWGAEPILTGISPLSERVVAGLEASHLVVSKDLPEAIALGFQVAELQRRGT
ncbi:MAG: hypothetical protein CL910_12580 [Deltaproteobacteria bacterium]|jgi:hypothetical protein|nr:hypothetical protein [Deltaproteobacteria bacterium]